MAKHIPQTFKEKDVREYQALYLKHYQEELSYEEAEQSLRNFLGFMRHVL